MFLSLVEGVGLAEPCGLIGGLQRGQDGGLHPRLEVFQGFVDERLNGAFEVWHHW